MKKIICLILATALVIFLCPAALAEQDVIEIIDAATGLIYTPNGEITGIAEGITDICIPSKINGTQITSIAQEAFSENEYLLNVSIEEGICKIGDFAFSGCTNLQSVILSKTVTSIGTGAFYECPSLFTVNIPDKIEIIPQSLFYNCTSLAVVNLPKSVKIIYDFAFFGCTNLRSMVFPEGVTAIGKEAFFGCSALENIYVSSTVTNIGENAFTYCTALKSIEVDEDNASYQSDGKALFSNNGQTLIQYALAVSDSSYTIPENVDNILEYAFVANQNLVTINLNNVQRIGEYAFFESNLLNRLSIPKTVSEIGEGAFSSCYNLTSVIFCGKTAIINSNAFADDYKLENVIFYQNPDIVGENIFENDLGVTLFSKDITFWQTCNCAELLRLEKLIQVFVNGEEIMFDVPPKIENGRTLVPMRAIFEALGAEVLWDDTTKTVTAKKGDNTVVLTIGENILYKNSSAVVLDTPAKIENSRTIVPVRAVSEGLSCFVSWDDATRSVIITE